MTHPVLVIGGSGLVGGEACRQLRAAHPDLPLLIGGRNRTKADGTASTLGRAEAVTIDMAAIDLGLGDRPVSAVATLMNDRRGAALRFAQSRGVAHLGIASGVTELGPDVANFVVRPGASPVVLGTEWLVGATTVPALAAARRFRRVDRIAIGAVLDAGDTGGPAAIADMQHVTETEPTALVRRDGVNLWLDPSTEPKASIRTSTGAVEEGVLFSAFDVMGLAAETGAPNVAFHLATGVTSGRGPDAPMPAEIVVEMEGEDQSGNHARSRQALVHPRGQMPLTALGVALIVERLLGLDGSPPVGPGLFFPFGLIDPDRYLARLQGIGGRLHMLPPG